MRSFARSATAIVLVAIVVFLFLGKWRTTLIPLVAVPVSIIGTFAVMLLIGYTANTVSLLALVLAIGIVVDDAIVVVENVERVIEENPELPVPDACKKAMAEITGPILAITFVLLSVFVPVAFIPGISGQLFRQFAVAVSVSMLISALNALTLSPALCAVLLKHGQRSSGPMRYVLGGIDRVARRLRGRGAPAGARRDHRRSWSSPARWPLRPGCSARRRRASCRTRTRVPFSPRCGFPKAPRSTAPRKSSSRSRTSSGRSRASRACSRSSGSTSSTTSRPRTRRSSSSGSSPTRSAPIRAQSAGAIIARLRPQLAAIKGAVAFPFNLPPILGLGSTGGFQYALEALQGQSPTDVAAALRALLVAANGEPELAGVYSTYAADTPQIYLDIDRDKVQVLGVKITDVFNALQATLGSFYVNDFNVFGRTWQVNIQAEKPFRDNTEDIYQIYVRNAHGGMVPMRALAEAKLVQGPQTIVRYNGFRGAIVNGAPKPGYSSGQALAAMERVSADHAAGRLQLRMDRHRAAGEGGERAHRHRARVRRAVRLSVSGRALRELEHPGAGPAVGQRRRARRASSRSCWPR